MAHAVTAWKSTWFPSKGPSKTYGKMVVEIDTTQLVADVDFDIGDLAGAFWTSAEADTTYGARATALKGELTKLYPLASEILIRSAALESAYVRVIGAPGAATQYGVVINATSKIPEIAFRANDAPTAFTLIIEFNLADGAYPLAPVSSGTI